MNSKLGKRKWISVFCILSSAIFLSLLVWRPPSIEESVETMTFDYRFHIRNLISNPTKSGDIVVVAIDEGSLKEFGRWPWSRALMAELVNEILNSDPKVLAVDIFFSEPESKKADNALGDVFKKAKDKIVLATTFDSLVDKSDKDIKDIPEQIIDSAFLRVQDTKKLYPVIAERVLPTVSEVSKDTMVGHVNSHPDYDGKLRWEFLYLKYGDEFFPSLALQTARLSLGLKLDEMVIVGNKGVKLAEGVFIPSDERGRMLINYLGKEDTFKSISASDILNRRVNKEKLRNRIVLLGTSAIATYDLKNTPFSANMSGVEKNATVVQNIVGGEFLKKSKGYIEILVLVLTGLIMGFVLPHLSALKAAVFSSVFLLGYIVAVQLFFSFMGLWANFIYPAANIMTISLVVTVAKYFFEEKKAREIRSMFSSYVSPKIVEDLISNPEKAKLGGERKIVTILFSDIMGFTSLSERRQPEEVVDLLNEYFKEMTDIIFKWDGTLDKFVGDEIMAFWGAPAEQPNHAELAVRCALNMTNKLSEMQEKWMKEGQEVLDCGIGINTGEVIIGNIGATGKKMDYTIIGDHVNLAARVEKLTRDYNAKIILTEFTISHLNTLMGKNFIGHYELKELDTVKVKGKEKEVKIFELKGMRHKEDIPTSHEPA
ncbi:MAG: hypothetical protein A2Z47_12555 [Thermodesulfovibrio sp. RBG_19FT_COMBO_42_12]|nr:MAG: hypothetical protein A2Z47_12555 [Thermodesulfovibrio sp. RBG_19FT_COMBO_42_12]